MSVEGHRVRLMPAGLSSGQKRLLVYAVAVFALSSVITLIFWQILPATARLNESSDYTGFYRPVARNIQNGHGIVDAEGNPAVSYPPGYPLILGALFALSDLSNVPEESALSIFALLSMGVSSVMMFFLARSMWGARPALISSFVWMTYPLCLWLTKQPNSEISFVIVFYAGLFLFLRAMLRRSRSWPPYFLAGLFIGLSMLIRPIAIGGGVAVGAIPWLAAREMTTRFRLRLLLLLLLGNFVVITPWEMWAYSRTGRVVPLSTAGVIAVRDGLTFAVNRKGYRQGVQVPRDVTALVQDILEHCDQIRSLGDVASVIARESQRRPLAVAKLFVIKLMRSWYGTDSQRFEIPIMLIQITYLALIVWSSVAAWKRGGTARQLTIGIWLVVLYFWAMTVASLTAVRYMVPAMGLLFTLLPVLFTAGKAAIRPPSKVLRV
jgi:4-amino-4-deoxy-L-arabinose transferase-like glycosyltransferase